MQNALNQKIGWLNTKNRGVETLGYVSQKLARFRVPLRQIQVLAFPDLIVTPSGKNTDDRPPVVGFRRSSGGQGHLPGIQNQKAAHRVNTHHFDKNFQYHWI